MPRLLVCWLGVFETTKNAKTALRNIDSLGAVNFYSLGLEKILKSSSATVPSVIWPNSSANCSPTQTYLFSAGASSFIYTLFLCVYHLHLNIPFALYIPFEMTGVLDYRTAVEVLKSDFKPDGLDVYQLLDPTISGGLTYDLLSTTICAGWVLISTPIAITTFSSSQDTLAFLPVM